MCISNTSHRKGGNQLRIIINNSSMTPIYEQIVAQIKQLIIQKELISGTALPSVRVLAKELRISALTVKKAYDALEQEGYVITVHGKGTYVADTNASLMEEEHKKKVETMLEEAIREGRLCGISDEELKALFEIILTG